MVAKKRPLNQQLCPGNPVSKRHQEAQNPSEIYTSGVDTIGSYATYFGQIHPYLDGQTLHIRVVHAMSRLGTNGGMTQHPAIQSQFALKS